MAEHTQGADLSALERGTDTATALAFYDGLPAVAIEDMLGRWRGAELPTGHPLDGLLAKAGWHGKRFDDADGAHPLIFGRGDGSHFAVDPAWIPLGLMTSWLGLAKTWRTLALSALLRLLPAPQNPRRGCG